MVTVWVCDENKRMAVLIAKYIERGLSGRKEKYKLDIYFSGTEVMDMLIKDNKAPDILFIAVKMRGVDGLMVGELFAKRYCRTLIIYVSAYEELLLQSIKYKPFGCMLKEKTVKELPFFLDKAMLKLSVEDKECVRFNSGGLQLAIPSVHIMYIRCSNKELYIGTRDNQEYKTRASLKSIRAESDMDFVLINRGVLINPEYVLAFNGREVVMQRGHIFLCSKSHRRELKKIWGKYSNELNPLIANI